MSIPCVSAKEFRPLFLTYALGLYRVGISRCSRRGSRGRLPEPVAEVELVGVSVHD